MEWKKRRKKKKNFSARDKQRCPESCVIAEKMGTLKEERKPFEWNGRPGNIPFRYDSVSSFSSSSINPCTRTQCISNLFDLLLLECQSHSRKRTYYDVLSFRESGCIQSVILSVVLKYNAGLVVKTTIIKRFVLLKNKRNKLWHDNGKKKKNDKDRLH